MSPPQIDAASVVKRLTEAGQHELAAQVAYEALKGTPTPSGGAPGDVNGQRDYLRLAELRSLTMEQVETLRTEHPEVYLRSLERLGQKSPVTS